MTFAVSLFVLSLVGQASAQLSDGRFRHPQLELENGNLNVVLTTDSANSELQVDMVYQTDDQGWLGWAFSEDEFMPGSVAVIALFQDDGSCTVEKYDMTGRFAPRKSQQQTLTDVSCSQTATETTMSFKKLLVEEGEPEIFLEQPNTFLYAIGPPGNSFGQHLIRSPVPNVVLNAEAPIMEAPTAAPVDNGETILLGDGRFIQPVLALEDGDLQVTFTTDPVQEEIQIDMVYTSDNQGWLGWAFSEDDFMPGSLAVIAQFQNDGSCTVEKYDLTARASPGKSQRQTLTDASCSQTGTETTMSFKKLLVEENEPKIFLDQANNFLYAIGPPGNSFGIHLIRQSVPDFAFVFPTQNPSETPTSTPTARPITPVVSPSAVPMTQPTTAPVANPTTGPMAPNSSAAVSPSNSSSDTGIIVGGAVGGLVAVCLTILGSVFLVLWFRHKYSSPTEDAGAAGPMTGVDPPDDALAPHIAPSSAVSAQVLDVTPAAQVVAARVPPINLEYKDQARSVSKNRQHPVEP